MSLFGKNILQKMWNKGLFHMFGARTINQVILFCSGMILVRILTKEDYGIYSYVQNTLAFFLLLDGLGASTGLLQYGSLNYGTDKMYAYFKISLRQGILANIFIAVLIIIYALLFVNDVYIKKMFFLAAFLPILNIIFSLFQIFNIVCRENKFYSSYTTINTILMMTALLIGAYLWNVSGIFMLNYVAMTITILIGYVFIKKHQYQFPHKNAVISFGEIKEYRKFSIVALGSNAISHIVLIIDVFLIGLIIGDMNTLASFKTATLIPFGLLFLPSTIMTFVYPYFAQNSYNQNWIKQNYSRLVKIMSSVFAMITVTLIVISTWLIPWIFGDQYSDAIIPFNILCIGFFFAASFRSPAGNILAALGKVKTNLYIAIGTGIINILLDIFLIMHFGSIGAAWSTATVFFLSALAGNVCIVRAISEIKVKDKIHAQIFGK